MPNFQLPVAIALVVVAACSLGFFLLFRTRSDGKIQLPTYNDEPLQGPDPFNVTKAEDMVDGYPVDGEGFWKRMRFRKIAMSGLLAVIVAILSICTGWASIVDDETQDIITYGLNLVYAIYTLIVSARSVTQDSTNSHAESMYHLASLSTTAAFLLGMTALIPDTPLPVTTQALNDGPEILNQLWKAVIALYVIVCIISFTTPLGPALQYDPLLVYSQKTVESKTSTDIENVSGAVSASIWDTLLFAYTTKVVMLGNTADSLEIPDLPIVSLDMRAIFQFANMRKAMREIKLKIGSWSPTPGNGWSLAYTLVRVNGSAIAGVIALASVSAVMFYLPAFFIQRVVAYLEADPAREDQRWGWVFALGLFASNVIVCLLTGQLWSFTTTAVQVRLRMQMNTLLFSKTLVRKDVASSVSSAAKDAPEAESSTTSGKEEEKKDDEDDFSSKAQIMTLMTTDVDRVAEFSFHLFALIDAPIEIAIGTLFLYKLLGVSCFFGLAITCLFLPVNHFAGKVVVKAQDRLMRARDERVALMNEILGGIRMLKFMAWERSFEKRVLAIRDKELKYQKLNYTIETLWNGTWNALPIFVTIVSFYHFTVIRQQILTPSVAFTSISVFMELKFALSALPETFINMLQSLVSLRRIEKYLNGVEVSHVPPLQEQSTIIAFRSATVTWPQDRSVYAGTPASIASNSRQKFVLVDLNLNFPEGQLSLVCGKLGSGKTLMLLALLGEVDLLTGQVLCPRSPPDALASFASAFPKKEEWVVPGMCAYVPQAAWLRNASIKENILFNLPYDEERYQTTLEVCALVTDLKILEDGDEAEIGERGVNLSGGQKARVSLARAVYSRASILFLDDVLSAVDAHTAHHLYHQCLKGKLMEGRTIILVSHHVQLCAAGAGYVVALDNGEVQFEGSRDAFLGSGIMKGLIQTQATEAIDDNQESTIEDLTVAEASPKPSGANNTSEAGSDSSSTVAPTSNGESKVEKKKPRKLVEEEKRAVGRIHRSVWETYIKACGGKWYWAIFISVMVIAAVSPVFENGWLKVWSGAAQEPTDKGALFYVGVYAAVNAVGLFITTMRWFILYRGSIHASLVLYQRLLETVLFANIRFHDTVSRGRLLNRFGKDFEGIDSNLSDNFGRSVINGLSVIITIISVSYVGGLPFVIAIIILGFLYWNVAKFYGQTSRDMRRLDSVTRSPLYSIYGETISGVTILRAFGAGSKFLRDMIQCVDTNSNPYYWMWGVNRWLSVRFNLLSSVAIGFVALVAVLTPGISASFAGFALAFASGMTSDLLFLVRRFVGLEQSMVALERVKEFSELKREPPEFIEPRPAPSWPEKGAIKCEDLVIRYAPELPNVLHNINFEVKPGEKVGILGRTGSGKSTLALSFFRFVEATEGRILVDDTDIAKIGLTDLRTKLTIIPQDPTILSGTLRSTLDVFDEYQDAEIFEALRRVHLIPSEETADEALDTLNANIFRNLDSTVSEGGENFSTGERQLLCMARAILKRSKVLVMDEATASVDYATDELISKTIRHEFADSTILTIAHRLRTVIDYDRVMLLDQGRIVEFDKPATLLADKSSQFYGLCKATGSNEFAMLQQMANGVSAE